MAKAKKRRFLQLSLSFCNEIGLNLCHFSFLAHLLCLRMRAIGYLKALLMLMLWLNSIFHGTCCMKSCQKNWQKFLFFVLSGCIKFNLCGFFSGCNFHKLLEVTSRFFLLTLHCPLLMKTVEFSGIWFIEFIIYVGRLSMCGNFCMYKMA